MGKVIGIVSIKGGVGKTTIAASLAADLVNNCGKKILLIDANYSAPNLGLHMDILLPEKTIHDVLEGRARMKTAAYNRYGVDVVAGSYVYEKKINTLKLKNRINNIRNDYDFIIIDSSPSLNEEVLSAMLASDNLFIVSTPDYPTLSCSMKAAKLAKQRGLRINGIMLNKIKDPKHEISIREIEETLAIPVVASFTENKIHGRALFTRVPVSLYDKKSSFSREIHNLSLALCNKKENKPLWKRIFSFNMKREEVNRQLLKESFNKKY
ncbi:MinD/ParA family protein [Candidatus Pacearchaeota archaeon]|nr:MinD/ParA family protein [Candidatus Pacearchaeota archaeon]